MYVKTGAYLSGVLILVLLILTWSIEANPTQAEDRSKTLTEAERAALEKEAEALTDKAHQMYMDGQYVVATGLLEKVLFIHRKLYPQNKYPLGHRELAETISGLGFLLQARGEYGKAEPFYREALDMRRKLYPNDRFPHGHRELATSLDNLGTLFHERGEYSKAEPFYREALDMRRQLYPKGKYPDGDPELAISLDNLGTLYLDRGEYGKAEFYYEEVLAMRRRLYPKNKFPEGQHELTIILNNLGVLLRERGEYSKAESYFRETFEICNRLYPKDKYPDGHPELATSLDNLGAVLDDRGDYGKAEGYYRDALDMRRRLYPKDKYPDGHPELATSLNNLGALLHFRNDYEKAEGYYRDALDMGRRLYPKDKYPDGHPELATSLNNLGLIQLERGKYKMAEDYFNEALEMRRHLFPDGHPELAGSLSNLGALLRTRGEYSKAAQVLGDAQAKFDRLTAAFAVVGAEAEALNYAASLPRVRNPYLFSAAQVETITAANQYSILWRGKFTLARSIERRRRVLHVAATGGKEVRGKVQELLGVKQDLARLMLTPAHSSDDDRTQVLKELTDRKERLEKDLAGVLPADLEETPPYTDLAKHLPDDAAFIDLYRYADFDVKSRKWDGGYYTAFVFRNSKPIRRVELGGAGPIEKDLKEWRDDIDKNFRSDAAVRLRKSVWEPIAKVLGDDIHTVYICPDAQLSVLPWAALPAADGGVLLENYTFAVVPYGPFLLEHLDKKDAAPRRAGVLLSVGGVRYDRPSAPADKTDKPWARLPATDKEREAVIALARKLPEPPEVVDRSGADANTAQLIKDLPGARWAHLATHGFFAAPKSTEREHMFRPDDFMMGVGGERRGAAARNPLTLSGLVLAGANQPTDADSGVLSAETVAGLNLDDMDLAVLSACQTGLGEAATGEGVFGLQRAFHIAGAKNVVASLWTVDDDATAALMNLFYYHLWEKNETPLKALHHAQLELYRNPLSIPTLARGVRAADFSETVQVVTKPPTDPKAPEKRSAAVKDWAAFILSGTGR